MAINSIRQDEEQLHVSKLSMMKRLFAYLLSYKKDLGLVAAIMTVTLTISMTWPLLMELAVNRYVAAKDIRGLLRLGAGALLMAAVFAWGGRMRMIIMAKLSNQVLMTIRQELYAHIQTLSFHFFDSRPTGKILARIIGDVNSLKDVLSDSITKLVPDLLTVAGVAIIMVGKNIYLAMAALLTMPLLAGGMFLIQKKAYPMWQLYRRKNSNLNAFVHEDFSGIRLVQSFAAEEESRKDFYQLADEQRDSFCQAVRCADCFGPIVEVTWGLGSFFLYFIGIRFLGRDAVGVGTYLAFSTYLAMFWSPIRNLASFYNKLTTNLSAAERVFDILDTPAEITDREGAGTLPPLTGRVEFRHVSFAYEDEPERLILKDVNFTADPGETIALVGPTGAGKTTIVNLIGRFYEVTDGEILLDGIPIQEVTLESLRSQMGIMTQDNFLFSGTIRDNIRYGRLNAADEEIEKAAKAVNAHEFIMGLENGYETEISERGSRLSIGQRQLLAFARTMVSNPGILILDEATSSIDTHTERLVQQGIEHLLAGRTSFVVAHRLSTIRKADRIFVIDQGNILEQGSHEELMEKKGAYYQLYKSQFE